MNKAKKILALVCCAALLVCISVGATLAYLTSQTEVVENTFTVGKVDITLDEADVNEEGEKISEERVLANEYKLMPGHTYIKDPTVHVAADSEKSYIRMIVTIEDIEDVKKVMEVRKPESVVDGNFLPQYLVEGWDKDVWVSTGVITEENGAATYEFRYFEIVETEDKDAKDLPALFTAIKIPGEVTNAELATLEELEINIIAHAIQADGFDDDVDAAWDAFDKDFPQVINPTDEAAKTENEDVQG